MLFIEELQVDFLVFRFEGEVVGEEVGDTRACVGRGMDKEVSSELLRHLLLEGDEIRNEISYLLYLRVRGV
jgi:hypothetical protein